MEIIKKMTFQELRECLKVCEEIEFWYKWLEYWFINWFEKDGNSYWYFLCNQINLEVKICLFEENYKLLNFLEEYKIDNKSIKEIFEEWLNY